MLLALVLGGCVPDCHPGFAWNEEERACMQVDYGADDGDDTATPTDPTDPTDPTEPPGSPGHYACDEGEGRPWNTGRTLRGACGTCTSITCTWEVFTVDDGGTVGAVDIDLYDVNLGSTAWSEYHDAFEETFSDADGSVWAVPLEVVLEPGAYESNGSTWVDVRNPDTLAGLSVQASVFDVDGGFLACFNWGPDTEAFGGDCPAVE